MKKYVIAILGLISISMFGQTKIEINRFSKKYKGVLTVEKGFENEIFKKGTISIIDSKTQEQIIEINSDELTFDLDNNGNVKTNIVELPYGEQSIIIYQDFNFDGIKDLAIMDGQHSCYHGPSFQVYLEIKDRLVLSSEFTRLAQEYCGMFQTDYESKTIHTMTKSGCCWHQFSTFKVINNVPEPISITEEGSDFPFRIITTTQWNNGKKTKEIEKIIDLQQEGVAKIHSFTLASNQKQVVLYIIDNRILNYALIRPDKTVEFSYPIETIDKNPDFKINKRADSLTFKNKDAVYKIYETHLQNKVVAIGIMVQVAGKSYNLKGNLTSLKGSLKDIKATTLNNVIAK